MTLEIKNKATQHNEQRVGEWEKIYHHLLSDDVNDEDVWRAARESDTIPCFSNIYMDMLLYGICRELGGEGIECDYTVNAEASTLSIEDQTITTFDQFITLFEGALA